MTERMTDILAAQLHELRQRLPEPPRLARVEVGQAVLDWLKATARPEGAPPDSPWRPAGWTPPPPGGIVHGVPVVLCDDLEPDAWRLIDHDGNVINEQTGDADA